jgi:hypothetical protein
VLRSPTSPSPACSRCSGYRRQATQTRTLRSWPTLVLRHQLAILQRQVVNRASPHSTAYSSPPCYTASHIEAAATAPDRLPRHCPALAPQPPPPTPRPSIPTETVRQTTHHPQHPHPHPPTRPREPKLGLPPHPRLIGHPRHQDRSVHRLGDPQNPRHRPSTSSRPADLDHVLAQPSTRHPRRRLLRIPNPHRGQAVRPRSHRAHHPPRPHPRRHRTPHRRLDL